MTIRGLRNRFHRVMEGKWRHVYYELKCRALGLDLGMESLEALGLSDKRSNWCSDSGGPDLEFVLDAIAIGEGDCAIDIGCGKGGAMITMARYPFRRIDGVEISPKVAAIARRNLERVGLSHRCRIRCGDAAELKGLHKYRLIYMYNPFPQVVMEAVVENIANSLAAHPRLLTFVYKNPVHHDIVRSAGFKLVQEYQHTENAFYVYRSLPVPIRAWMPAVQMMRVSG